jgi:hypothetical protein
MQIQAELFRATYEKRVELYQGILQMFSDVYWIERKAANLGKAEMNRRRTELIRNVQRQIGSGAAIMNKRTFELAFDALNYYIAHSDNFTAQVRSEWVSKHFDPLVVAIRKDLHQDEIAEAVGEKIFQNTAPATK